MIEALPSFAEFRSMPQRTSPQGVDRTNKVVMGAKVIEAGDLNDSRTWTVDDETLHQVVELAANQKRGVKARFTHPNMSDDGLGNYLGRWQGFYVRDGAVYADLHIAESAHDVPGKGDIATYVMDLAEEDPEAFGVSLATVLDESMVEGDDGAPLRFSKIRAADFVDEPAATRGGLFAISAEDPRDLPAVVTRLLDTHFGKNADPEVVSGRFHELLSRYLGTEVIPVSQDQRIDAKPENTRDELGRYVEAFGDVDGAKWYLAGMSFAACYQQKLEDLGNEDSEIIKGLKDDLAAATQEIQDLKEQIQAADLGETEELSSSGASPEEAPRSKRFSEIIRIRN